MGRGDLAEMDQKPFPAAEYDARLQRVRRAAAARSIDLLAVTDPKNICYLTGYDVYAFYVPQVLLVPIAGDPLQLIVRAIDVTAAHWATHLADEQIHGYGDQFITAELHPMAFVADLVKARRWHRSRIAVEVDGSALNPIGLHTLEHALPDATFVPMSRLVEWVRCIKSERELAVMREAGRLSDHAMKIALASIGPGVSDASVAARTYAALIHGVDGITGSAPWQPYMAAGPRTNSGHCRWINRAYRQGEPAMIELAGHRHNYAAGLSRTAFIGEPPDDYRVLEETVQLGMAAALTKLRAGYRAEEVKQAWERATTLRSVVKADRIGYSIGLSFPDTCWVERTVSLAKGDMTALRPNMTVHLMPAVWLGTKGYSLSETFIVNDANPESLSSLKRDLELRPVAR